MLSGLKFGFIYEEYMLVLQSAVAFSCSDNLNCRTLVISLLQRSHLTGRRGGIYLMFLCWALILYSGSKHYTELPLDSLHFECNAHLGNGLESRA